MLERLKDVARSAGLVAIVLLIAVVIPVEAAMPTHTGVSYPDTFWARMDYTNNVTGKVIASSGQSAGLEGAYVAIVNASNPDEEYANTTTDASGNFSFSSVNATYYQNPDRYDPQYMVYAYAPGYGEAYSQAFRIDAGAVSQPFVMWVVIPVNTTTPQNSIAPTMTPTPTVKPSPSPMTSSSTPVIPSSMPVPSDQFWSLKNMAIYSAVIVLVLALAGAYLYIRRR